jgi:gag-polyprotein putative aspartyl protease
MKPNRPAAFAALFLLLSVLTGCASQDAGLTPAAQAEQQTAFTDGRAMLFCNFDCVGNYGAHRQEMKADYAADNWSGLSADVLNIGENIDQAWFYLGAAAEGQGYDNAAQRYYFISLISRFQCRHGINICDGLDLPALTEQRLLALNAKIAASPAFAQPAPPPSGAPVQVHLLPSKDLAKVPVLLNGKVPLLFSVDSGSTGVVIPEGVAILMFDQGILKKSDIIGETHALLADGSAVPVFIIHIASLQIGGIVLKNVTGGIAPGPGELLLGQTFLNRFKSWSIDNSRQLLILQPAAS